MNEKKPEKKPLSLRERKFIKALAEGQPPTTAMRTAGYSDYTARWGAGKKLREPKIQETLQELMDTMGITDAKLLDTLRLGLEATKAISATITVSSDDGIVDAHSMTKAFVEVDDYAVRHKYLETGFKLKGHFKERGELTGKDEDPAPKTIYELSNAELIKIIMEGREKKERVEGRTERENEN